MVNNKIDENIWLKEVDKYKDVRLNLGIHIKESDLNKNPYGLKSANWYRFNAPEYTEISTYNDFLEWCGFDFVNKKYTITKEGVVEKLINMNARLGKITVKDLKNSNPENLKYYEVLKYWNKIGDMQQELGFVETGTFHGDVYTKEQLIEYIHMFREEFDTLPTPESFNKPNSKYPTRKTFNRYFGSVGNAVIAAGYEYSGKNIKRQFVDPKYNNSEFLIKIIFDYIDEFNEIPTIRKISAVHDKDLKNFYKKHFGSWNNCLKSLNLQINSVSQHTDEELAKPVHEFVKENNHTPTIQDFLKTGRPSFWCYQNKFGSWNKAMTYYGYEINDKNHKFTLEDGEICESGYEHTISQWLKNNNIKYDRNVGYKLFIDGYNGRMDCDYKFTLNDGTVWYVEMAGFLTTYDYTKMKELEKKYLYKIQYKKKLLKRQNCNYVIITVEDFKSKKLEEIFFFLFNSIKDAI